MTRKKPVALPTSLGPELEKLAIAITQELSLGREVQVDGKPELVLPHLDERIAGFRALTAYYAMINKLPPPPDDSKGGFGGYKNAIRDLGGSAARTADRSNGADSF